MDDFSNISPGTHVGRYEILQLDSENGLTRRFQARDPELGRRVTVKVNGAFEPNFDPNSLLLNEARTLADLQHPSISNVFDVGRHDGQVYLVLEYLPGCLKQEVRRAPDSVSHERVADVVEKVADALDFIHRRGYLHRNIKPHVIFLDAAGQPRLSDFELAVRRDGLESVAMAGTVPYMAPEQLRSELDQFGPHTDVWGLGVTMYELLCGERPFRADSIEDLVRTVAYTNVAPTPPSKIVKSIPEALEQICLKCLSPEPAKRYTTANLLAEDMREWRREIGSPKQKRVFVSHSSKDRDFVEQQIVSVLENAGIATWYSKVDIQTASEWGRSILQGLQSSEWFLLVMSSKSISSEWVKDELYWAIENRPERVIPVMIDDCDPEQFHIRLKRLQHIDFRHNRDEAQRRLIAAFG